MRKPLLEEFIDEHDECDFEAYSEAIDRYDDVQRDEAIEIEWLEEETKKDKE